jgi:hypothetical protein
MGASPRLFEIACLTCTSLANHSMSSHSGQGSLRRTPVNADVGERVSEAAKLFRRVNQGPDLLRTWGRDLT